MSGDAHDPKGLIREAYRIEGIGAAECRSILVDWALSLPAGTDPRPLLAALVRRHAGHDDHPMTALLREGAVAAAPAALRRGGAAGRRGRAPYPDA